MFVIADFNKNISGRTYVMPDNYDKVYKNLMIFEERQNTSFGELVKMDNDEFENNFVVYSSDQIEARYILSSSMMEKLLNLRNRINTKFSVCFYQSHIYLIFPFPIYLDLIKINIRKKSIQFDDVKDYYLILLSVVNIVEELDLNTRIWTKE